MRTKIFFICFLAIASSLAAKEGMFPLDGVTPSLAADMKAMGCRFDPAGIWRPGRSAWPWPWSTSAPPARSSPPTA